MESSLVNPPVPVSIFDRISGYIALTKPRIIELLLVTTIPPMIVAAGKFPSVGLILATVIGGTLAAGGASAVNMYVDRDIDRIMKRTQNRPLVTGVISPSSALVFAIALEIFAFIELWVLVNPLSALLTLSGALFYIFIYTLWLKRISKQNIVIGGAAGAVPVLVGWTAVTDHLSLTAWILFVIVFVWTPPHFWALAFKYKDDYSEANVPMLPSVVSFDKTVQQIILYTFILVGLSLVLAPVAGLGIIYTVSAILLGLVFIFYTFKLRKLQTSKAAMHVFAYSISYITLLFAAMAIDVLVGHL